MLLDPPTLAQHRARAAQTRSRHILGVSSGMFTVDEVVQLARTNPTLRKIRLVELLAARPGSSRADATRRIERFKVLARHRRPNRTCPVPDVPKVSLLVNPSTGPELAEAWDDATRDRPMPPWPGFPHHRRPA